MRRFSMVGFAAMISLSSLRADAPKPTAEQLEFFEKSVRPLLIEQCHSCHGEKKQQAGLRLDTAAGLLKGSDDGAVVVAGDLEKSKLIQSVRRKGDYAMPPADAEALSEREVIELLKFLTVE